MHHDIVKPSSQSTTFYRIVHHDIVKTSFQSATFYRIAGFSCQDFLKCEQDSEPRGC